MTKQLEGSRDHGSGPSRTRGGDRAAPGRGTITTITISGHCGDGSGGPGK